MIETERLEIRRFQEDDRRDLYQYLSLPEIYTFEPGEPITETQARELAAQRSCSDDFYAVVLKSENKMIGHLYFHRTEPEEFRTWELGYIFNPAYQNMGYCTEASRRIIRYGFQELGAHRITAYCNPLNIASLRVLEKAGMIREGVFRKQGFFRKDAEGRPIWHDTYAYGILEEDFRSASGSASDGQERSMIS
jgi:ribosomal-protein-alanine N-acetyltransferase